MKKFFSLLSILIFPLAACAMPEHRDCMRPTKICEGPNCPHHIAMKQRLNLSEEQREKAKALRMDSQAKMQPYVDELKTKQSQIMALISEEGNETEIQQLREDIKRLKHQIHGMIIQNEREFIQILTPEQRAEFNKMRQEGKRELHGRRFNQFNMK